jgi:hypothetical protein
MNHVQRFRAVMDFQPVDRLPRWEWAVWWDVTVQNWKAQGMPEDLESAFDIARWHGLDPYRQFWFSACAKVANTPEHGIRGTVSSMDEYLAALRWLYPDPAARVEEARPWAARQARGEAVVWITLDGFYWHTRTLMGIEDQMYGFYDQPELVHRASGDLCEFNLRLIDKLFPVCVPTFATIAEDMSCNQGPMLSKELFDEFLAPYYRRLVPRLVERNVLVLVDSDGDVTRLVPWLAEAGIQGVLPLERRSGVDGMAIRATHPRFRLIGHFDKMTMGRGEAAMRREFERLMPLMRSGGFIPGVDHQTPPHVTLEDYRIYLRLLSEYTAAAAG